MPAAAAASGEIAAENQVCEECEAPRAKARQGGYAKFCFECGHNFTDTPILAEAKRGKVYFWPLRQLLSQA